MSPTLAGIHGFIWGIFSGIYCTFTCALILLPIIVISSRNAISSLNIMTQFLAGRIAAYAMLCSMVIIFGRHILFPGIGQMASAICLIILAIFWAAYGLKINFPQMCICISRRWIWSRWLFQVHILKIPFLSGFVVGINACPPILTSIIYALTIKDALSLALFLCLFFIGTMLFTIPFSFGYILGKSPQIKGMAQVAVFLSALWFISRGISIILRG